MSTEAQTSIAPVAPCPACPPECPYEIDFLACAQLMIKLDPKGKAFASWKPWAEMLCGSHKVEWCAALVKADAR